MVAWPAIRPPLRDGWDGGAPDGTRWTEMDSGPPKGRVESVAEAAPETLVFKLSDADRDTLDDFYAANKVARIDYTHPIWGACQVEFEGPPRWRQLGVWNYATVRVRVYR